MSIIEQSVVINRTTRDIFAFLSVADNHARFIPGMVEVKQTSPGSFAQAGATARGVRRDLALTSDVRYDITEVEQDKRLSMNGVIGPFRFRDGYILETLGSTTRVHFWLDLSVTGLMRLGNPFLRLVGKTHARETLANLKHTLESSGSMAVDPYEAFRNPVTLETFRCIRATPESYMMEWIMEPGGYIPFEHIHVAQDEVCHVQKGTIRALIDGNEQIGRAGETLHIPRGTKHVAFNDTAEPLTCIIEYTPGLDVFKSFQCFGGLTLDNDHGHLYGFHVPKMMYFMKKLDIEALVRPAFVPNFFFRLGLTASLVVGNLMGWEEQCRRYTEGYHQTKE